MRDQVIYNIYDILRGDSSLHQSSQTIFVLQVLSWLKLSQDGVLPEDKKFENARFAEGPIHPSLLEYLFLDLANNKSIGENAKGFDTKKNSIARMNHSSITALLDFLWSAYQSNNIDYEKALWEIVQFVDPRSDSPALPFEVAKLAFDIADIKEDDSVYCPFESSYNAALLCSKISNNVSTESPRFSPYPYLVNILCNTNIKSKFSDPIEAPSWVEKGNLKRFDLTLAFPPFSMRYRKNPPDIFNRFQEKSLYGEVLHIRHCLAHTKRRAVIAVAPSILFRTSAGEKILKQSLVEKGIVKAVISLPPALLRNTTIPFALLVLDLKPKKAINSEIIFIDASDRKFFKRQDNRNILCNTNEILSIFENPSNGPHSALVKVETCEDNDFNLLPNRYVLSSEQKKLEKLIEASEVIELGKIADLTRPQSVRSKDEGKHKFLEVMVSDIPLTGYIQKPERSVLVSNKLLQKAKQQRLEPLDILVSVKGTIGAVGIVPPELEGEWLAGQSFQIIRLKGEKHLIHPIVLYMYLRSHAGKEIIRSKAAGTAVQMIQIRDIKNLPVILLTKEEQKKVLKSFDEEIAIQQKMKDLEQQLDSIKEKHWA